MGYCIDCPKGWKVYKGRCYLLVHDENISWIEAQEKCERQGADLVNIPEDENNFYNFWIPFVSALGLVKIDGKIEKTFVIFKFFSFNILLQN